MARLGTKLASGVGLTYRKLGATLLNQVAVFQIAQVCPTNLYITRIGAWARKTGVTSQALWYGIYTLNDAGAPTTLLARTDKLALSAAGGDVSGDLVWVNPAVSPTTQTALRMVAGERFIVMAKFDAPPGVADGEIAYYGQEMVTHYLSTNAPQNTPPSNPYVADATEQDLALSFYVEYTENTAPTATLTSPLPDAALATVTPTIAGTFSDPQGSLLAPLLSDRMRQYELEVISLATGAVMWGGSGAVFTASAEERANNAFSRVYSGAALSSGTTYRLRAKVYDDSGAASNWTAPREFTISSRGCVRTDTDGVPTGKIDGDPAAIAYTGRWSHPTPHAMDAARVFIYLANGQLFRAGSGVVKAAGATTAQPGNLFTISAAEAIASGVGILPPGSYTYRIAGRSAVNGLYSEQSDPRAFIVNAPPTTPANLQPANGATLTAYPFLEWKVSDPDGDVFGTEADSEIEITPENGVAAYFTTGNYDAARGVGFLQLSNTHLAVKDKWYYWRVRGRDLSALATGGGRGPGAWSAPQSVYLANGPVVTITNPLEGEIENTTAPVITWSVSGGSQARARVTIFADDSLTPLKVYNIAGSVQQLQTTAGLLRKGSMYDVQVEIWTAGEIRGASVRRRFSVDYVAPEPPSNVQASPYAERRDYYLAPSSIMISWDQTQYSPGEFAGYNIYRRTATQSAQQATLLRTLTSAGQTRWRDAWPPSRTLMLYGVSQNRNVGGLIVESPITWVEAEIRLIVPILVSAYDPDLRFTCMYMERTYKGKENRPKAYYTTWGSGNKRIKATAPKESAAQQVSLDVTLRTDARGHLYEHIADLEALVTSGHPLLFRTENPAERFYADCEWSWSRGGVGERVMSLTLEEIDFTPGANGGT